MGLEYKNHITSSQTQNTLNLKTWFHEAEAKKRIKVFEMKFQFSIYFIYMNTTP